MGPRPQARPGHRPDVRPDARLCAFGKIPGRADFIIRGLSPALRRVWDDWVQDGLAAGQRIHGTRWLRAMSEAPIWRLHLPPELASGAPGLLGVMLPSADSVGRPYPLLLGVELSEPVDPLPLMAGSARWFAAVEALALDALTPEFEPEELGRRLLPRLHAADLPATDGVGMAPQGAVVPLPMASAAASVAQSLCGGHAARLALFWSTGGKKMPPMLAALPSLVPERLFPALIDGHWRSHGWNLPATEADPAQERPLSSSWDREV